MNYWINTLGLIFDIMGVGLLYKFGLPPNVNRRGVSYYILEKVDEDEIKKAKRFDKYSKVGIWLIFLGFALQVSSNILSIYQPSYPCKY